MQLADIFKIPQYSLEQAQKEQILIDQLNALTEHHHKRSESYKRILNTFYEGNTSYPDLCSLPSLPVSLFKHHELLSIPKEEVFKTLTSSGTTGSQPSRIFLDRDTAQRQIMALANIMTSILGQKRLPMLIIDSPSVIKDRKSFSARGAGILGMFNFGRNHFYALDDQMNLNREGLQKWIEKHHDEPVLIFGFTFMVWQYLLSQLNINDLSLPQGILIHSGGWKKLQEQAVSNAHFKEKLREVTGITRCHGFYGMVEQVGSVFVECEEGHNHAPNFADVIVRNPKTWKESHHGEKGIIQVLSILPKSYPGHSLLTEDMGYLIGIDNCPCGRKGKYFQITGRIPKAEVRGCSDTHAYGSHQ